MSAAPKDDGGPAFPQTVEGWNGHMSGKQPGMTLRDYFAGRALAGLLAHHGRSVFNTDAENSRIVSACAFILADAMLAARRRSQEG